MQTHITQLHTFQPSQVHDILAFTGRSYYYPKLDELLCEETLVGHSPAGREALRPLSLSMLAELIHHVRSQLTYEQLATIVHTFSRCGPLPTFLLRQAPPLQPLRAVRFRLGSVASIDVLTPEDLA